MANSANDAPVTHDRAKQISAFNAELAILQQQQLLQLTDTQRHSISIFHQAILSQGTTQTSSAAQHSQSTNELTWLMRFATLIGASAFCMSLFFLFYQYWGNFVPVVQSSILLGTSLASLGIASWFIWRHASHYFAKLSSIVAVFAFILNVVMLAEIYNLPSGYAAFLAWGGLAFILAYATQSRLLLAGALGCFSIYIAALSADMMDWQWHDFFEQPENFLASAAFIALLALINHRWLGKFAASYRFCAALIAFSALLVLSIYGQGSYLPFEDKTIEWGYQIITLLLGSGCFVLAHKYRFTELRYISQVALLILLYIKFFQWCWDWLPNYVFFFIIGFSAVAVIVWSQKKTLTSNKAGNKDSHDA